MAFGGAALKLVQTFFYILLFCCSGIILGIYSYFLAVQADHKSGIPKWQKAVEGMVRLNSPSSLCDATTNVTLEWYWRCVHPLRHCLDLLSWRKGRLCFPRNRARHTTLRRLHCHRYFDPRWYSILLRQQREESTWHWTIW